jgi:DNA-binding NarL/FixJ family response regulator
MSYGRWFLVRVVGIESDEQVSAACSLLERVVVDGHGLRDELRVACLPYGATFAATAWTTDYVILSGSNTAWADEVRASVAAAAGTALPGLTVEFDWMGDLDGIRALEALDDPDDRPIEVPALYPDIHSFRPGEEAVELAATLAPDVILMDIRMPGCNGIDATRRIVAANQTVRVLVVSMFEDDASIFTAMRAGARGYILKDADRSDILRAIRAIGQGEAIFSPAIAMRLLDNFTSPSQSLAATEFPELTTREREILEMVADGYRNADIARQLVLSPTPYATTSRASSPNSRSAIGERRSSGHERPGLAGREPRNRAGCVRWDSSDSAANA